MSTATVALAGSERTRSGRARAALRSAGIGAAAFALVACARVAAPPAPRTVMVNVPVLRPVYCAAPALNPPSLAIASLGADSPPADTMRSYVASVMVLKSAVRERDSILKGCAAPTDGDGQNSVDAGALPQASGRGESGGEVKAASGVSSSGPGVAAASADKGSGGKTGGGFAGAVVQLVGKLLRPLKVSW